MEITLNSVWKTNETDALKTGLYRILGMYIDTDTLILFELQDNCANKPFFSLSGVSYFLLKPV